MKGENMRKNLFSINEVADDESDPIEEQTPVASIFGISSIYLGVFFLFVLIIQTKQLGLLCLV